MGSDTEVLKEREYEIRNTLFANRGTAVSHAMKEYCMLRIEEVKEQLVYCEAEEVSRLQGEAKAFYNMLEAIEESPNFDEATGE